MMMKEHGFLNLVKLLGLLFGFQTGLGAKPLKVYILAGQSNMQGSAHRSTFEVLKKDPESAPLAREFLDENGEARVAERAWVAYQTNRRGDEVVLHGKVKVGYGFDDERVGPEYGFGIHLDRVLDEPVLIIKTAWGGKSLAVDFRPPSAGPYKPSEREKAAGKVPGDHQVGFYYRKTLAFVKDTLEDKESIRKVVPAYDQSEGYELSGFVWFQGWNDLVNRDHTAQYTENLIHFIQDVRRDLDEPKLPFVVGILGVYGTDPDSRKFDKGLPVSNFRKQQFEAVRTYDQKAEESLRGRVVAVDSGPFYDLKLSDIYWKRRLTGNWKQRMRKGEMTREQYLEECLRFGFGSGELTPEEREAWDTGASNAEYHYLGSGKTFIGFGRALAEAMLNLEKD